jgi:hypothetical protein
MAFPINPSPGDTYTDAYGTVWVYAGSVNGWYRQTVYPVNDTTYIGSDGAPGGAGGNTQVVFNDNGSLAGDSGLTYNKTTDALSSGAFVPTGSTVPTNGVYRPSANNVAISTGGTGRLFIDSSGRVGLGTSSPSRVLTVVNSAGVTATTAEFNNSGGANSQIAFGNTTNTTPADIRIGSSGSAFQIVTGNTTAVTVDSSRRVGLGTSSPGSILHSRLSSVSGATYRAATLITEANGANEIQIISANNNYGQLRFGDNDSNYRGAVTYDHATDNLQFITAGANPAVTIDSSQRVGIGTATVSDKLHVRGVAPIIRIDGGSDPGTYGIKLYGDTTEQVNFTYSNQTGENRIGGVQSYVFPTFFSGGSERARIDTSGRLLVGTSTSFGGTDALVQIQNASGPNIALNLNDGTVASGQFVSSLDFYSTGGFVTEKTASIQCFADGAHASGDKPGRLVFSTTADGAASPTERMRISQDGRVDLFGSGSIANQFGSAKTAGFDYLIVGKHSATGIQSGTTSFQVFTNGNVANTNNSYGAISDIRLKENIVDANSQWDDLKALQVRNYNFKEGQTHTQIGLIAQEAELVSPGLVSESPDLDEEGNDLGTVTKSVNYSVLYMKAVKALQEAMERIEVLEAKVAALETYE